MTMMNYLKKKFGRKDKDVPETEQFFTPLRIALHSTVILDTVDYLTNTERHPSMPLPEGGCEVLAIGTFCISGSPFHHVYIKDQVGEEFVLQIAEGKDYRTQQPIVGEITLYKQIVTIEPETEAEIARHMSQIGFSTIEVDEITYQRLWGDKYTEKQDFRTFVERVVTPSGSQTYEDNYILYSREIADMFGSNVPEFLLVGYEESSDQAQIVMLVGLPMKVQNITVR